MPRSGFSAPPKPGIRNGIKRAEQQLELQQSQYFASKYDS